MRFEFFGFILEILTALIATATRNKYRLTKESNFILFFWIIAIIDISGYLIKTFSKMENHFLYNLLFLFYFIFILTWFYKILINKKVLKIIIFFYVSTLLFALLKQNFLIELLSIHFVGGALSVVICSLIYFQSILNSDKILVIKSSLAFWIIIGNIIYFVGMLPLIILQKYLSISNYAYSIILVFVNVIAYSCYILGFLWVKKK